MVGAFLNEKTKKQHYERSLDFGDISVTQISGPLKKVSSVHQSKLIHSGY